MRELEHLNAKHDALIERVLDRSDAIVDQRLGLNQKVSLGEHKTPLTIGRKNWKQVQAKFEADKRAEFWSKKIKDTEKEDAKIIAAASPKTTEK